MTLSPTLALACFLPVWVGLLIRAVQPYPLDYRLLFLALLVIAVEQAHMARVDLRQIEVVSQHYSGNQLTYFSRVVLATIGLELVGFYTAVAGYPGWGMWIILGSLIGFNLMANLRIEPASQPSVHPAGIASRLDVLLVDLVALGLGLLWMANIARLWVAALLLGLALLYETNKLLAYFGPKGSQTTSSVHITDSTE
jgi:uncharacterized membrane protein